MLQNNHTCEFDCFSFFSCLYFSYLKFNELKNIPCFKENTIIAVKAPKDSISVIEVSDPHETGVSLFFNLFLLIVVFLEV